ncbi:hypothetical protein HBO37_19160 [Pseudomonas proteolytica]|uniref:hypothetical protein n=1 Tax=Pseudomonas proteolytica TaxID=219574 RepID=UPI001473E35F|nr:hypothetical protein [Pseudomonas proteolytica]NMZ07470.1 hypothetical protein [Pseudomonas proteolytica]
MQAPTGMHALACGAACAVYQGASGSVLGKAFACCWACLSGFEGYFYIEGQAVCAGVLGKRFIMVGHGLSPDRAKPPCMASD